MLTHGKAFLQIDTIFGDENFMDKIPIKILLMLFIIAYPHYNLLLSCENFLKILELGDKLTV